MTVTQADFVLSAAAASQLPPDPAPHVALVGRSNVGKSSLINALVRRPLARTSAKPGKTRLLNAYRIRVSNGLRFLLVDLPGYGYARGASEREFEPLVAGYFAARGQADTATLALHCVDGRHPALPQDIAARGWLDGTGVAVVTVVTKLDKLSASERARHLGTFARTFEGPLVAVSAERGEGLDTLWTTIRSLLLPS